MLDELFAAIDAKDAGRFAGFLAENARFRFGSAPPVSGREAIGGAVNDFFGTIDALRHDIRNTIGEGETLVCEGAVTYTRMNGTQIELPFADVFEMNGDRISDYKIYMDIAPLYSE